MIENLGRYEILADIGQGAFAVVYRAHDTQLNRLVALKELRSSLLHNPDSVKDFRQEARHIAHLDHPHIVTIYDIYEEEQRQFIVMQLVDGSSLAELIVERGRLSWPETVDTITAVAGGLDYAHTRGILHCDLKPANILVDANHGPMLSDFGLAKLMGEANPDVTAGGGIVGTAPYIAPEVWEGRGITRQSDIYALGCIVYEMLTGEKLYQGETPPAVMLAHLKGLTLPQTWPEGVPSKVADVLTIALAKKPTDRYATGGEMVQALVALTTPQLEPDLPETTPASPPILITKLYIPPSRSEFVPRPRLIKRLNEGLDRKLTLVSAPAGFGKTTLIANWGLQIADFASTPSDIKLAWLSLDEADNDPTRFLSYFIAALQQIDQNIGRTAQGMLQSPQPPPTETLMITLINEFSASFTDVRCVFVLDDYHLIEAKAIDDALTFLIERLPPQMHLVIATRDDPHLPLARLRARNQLSELRATDLRFTSAEAAEFLNQVMGLNLSAEDISALETRTEGWIAGLQLAAISMQGRADTASLVQSFTGSHRHVLDYLVEEVLDQQSESVQTFLLQTAVLNRLTGSLCDALTDQDNGQATLEMLEHANLFIVPLDDERRWYRYHHLFGDLLRVRLRQSHSDKMPMLQIRASEWFAQNGFIADAVEYALRAEDFERAANLIEDVADAECERGGLKKLGSWLDALPKELLFSKPYLSIFHANSLFISGQQSAAEKSLQSAEKSLYQSTKGIGESTPGEQIQLLTPDQMKMRGRVAATRAVMAFYQGNIQGLIQYASEALEYLPEQDVAWRRTATVALGDAHIIKGEMAAAHRVQLEALEASKAAGNIYMILIANLKLAITLGQRGRLRRVIEICRQQLQLAGESGLSQTVVVGWLLAIWGEVLAEINDLDGAIHQAKKGTELTRRGGDVAMLGWSYLCLTRVLFSRGDLTGAEEIIREVEDIARESDVPPWITNLIAAWQVRIWLAQNNLEAASQWMQEHGLDAGREPTLLYEMDYSIILARILMAQGRLDETTELLQRLLESVEMGGRTSKMIEILMLQALTFQAGGDTDQAMTTLEKALTLAEPDGFIRTFVDEGPPMAHLLYEALNRGIAPDYARRLLSAFPVAEPEQATPLETQALKSDLIEPLSEREIEILRLIAEGLTNPEIAGRLYLTLNTVKVHTRNIYGKLDAHNRTQAVAQARALGILPSI